MSLALAGKTIVVTRDEPEHGPLGRALSARGATVVRLPCLRTAPPEDRQALDRELGRLAEYDWLLLTSARAVEAIADRPRGHSRYVAAVGRATAREAREVGLAPDVIGQAGAAALPALMAQVAPLDGAKVLFPASDRSDPEGSAGLAEAGADVTQVTAYRILEREGAADQLRLLARDPSVHALTFTSPSAVDLLGPAPENRGAVRIAAIGATTAAALEAAGWKDIVVPSRPEFEELARALVDTFRKG